MSFKHPAAVCDQRGEVLVQVEYELSIHHLTFIFKLTTGDIAADRDSYFGSIRLPRAAAFPLLMLF